MSNDIVGTRIGIYDVLYECENRANDGHHVGLGGIYTSTTADFVWSNKRLQRIFLHMKERCYVSKHKDYRWYGAKGIKICDEWINNPKSFEEWALANGYSDNLTIDRKEEDKDYCPENCHWISLVNNAKYKSTTSLITANNETHTGQDWARILGFGINRINEYIRIYGLDNTVKFIEAYLKNPGLKPKHKQSYYDLYMTIQN